LKTLRPEQGLKKRRLVNTMAKTKDEKFIICAYETTGTIGDLFEPIDRYEIGARVGINRIGVDTICRLLAQANFIKFVGKTEIRLTSNGKELAESFSHDG